MSRLTHSIAVTAPPASRSGVAWVSTQRLVPRRPVTRMSSDPDSPASDKQRNYIATLQDQVSWNSEQLAAYAEEQAVDLVTMTKGQASVFIDGLKKLSEERSNGYAENARTKPAAPRAETPAPRPEPATPRAEAPAPPARPADGTPVNEKQIHAMERLAQQQGLDLDMESRRRFGVVAHGLTYDQASTLLRDLQRPAGARRPATESAL